jgi:hypothetical protein
MDFRRIRLSHGRFVNNKDSTVMTQRSNKAWYHTDTANGQYYAIASRLKKKHYVLGTGEKEPTPAELYEFLQAHPNAEMSEYGLLAVEYDSLDTQKEPVYLPGGFYRHEKPDHYEDVPERLIPAEVRQDTVVSLPETFTPIIDDIKAFMSEEAKQIDIELNIQHKLGILLYGPPGTGKTTLIRSVLKDIIPADAIVVFMETLFSNKMIEALKSAENDRLKVLVFEEMVTAVENIKIDRLLDFLDGERSLNNMLVIGTTNYPEKLPGNIADRPGRFDRLYKIGDPNKGVRNLLIDFYLSRPATDEEIKITDGMSAAAIKELCLIMRRHKKDMQEASVQIKKHRELVKREFSESRPMGLVRSDDDLDD